MSFTKLQVEFIKRAFDELIGKRKFIECAWYDYKSHSHPLEADVRTLENGGVHFFEYDHAPGGYGFNVGTSYGVTGCPNDFKSISINADDFTIHFRYDENDRAKVYRAFKVITDGDMDSAYWRKWQDVMQESWKLE